MADRLIPQAKLLDFTAGCLEKLGLLPADARLVADTLLTSNLRGVDSHGVVRLPHYATRLRNGSIEPKPSLRMQRTGPATAMLDGGAGMGQLAAVRAMKEAIALAREAGAGAVGVKNSSHCGACAYYAELAASEGMIGIALTHADPIMVPTGMKRIFLGSNPIAFAAPGASGPPVVVDMATTHVALGRILVAKEEGRPIPPDWGLDAEGKPTTDPNKVAGLAPMGGAKGYALALAIEVLCAHLTGVPFGRHIVKMYGELDRPRNLGHFMLALDIARFSGAATFKSQIDALLAEIAVEEPADAAHRPLAPGEPERRSAERRMREGIPLGAGLLADLNKLAGELGVGPL